ncbi:ATP-binding protein [Candidatus Gracilibacteria bacterium]|nr:ATP-binding protein [Candidatus Gracilibacteria bacterium]
MFEELLENNIRFIKELKLYHPMDSEVSLAVHYLNTERILSVSGIRHSGKSKLIHSLLKKTHSFESCFYYNSDIDTLGVIRERSDLITLLDMFIRIYGIPKIIILQNINMIEGIKGFISQLIKTEKYKIVIVGNNIKIEGVKEIELFPLGIDIKKRELIQFGGISEVRVVPEISYKQFLLQALKHDIVSRDILESYSIKNINLFYQIMTFLSKCDSFQSMRNLHRELAAHSIEISLLTMIEYLSAAINTKLIYRCYLYDIKQDNVIQSQAIYYFGDVGIKTAFSHSDDILENLIYLEFMRNGFVVYGGLSGRFQFSFRAEKNMRVISIAIEKSQDRNEIRKTARKLAKLGDSSSKFVLIENKDDLAMRKFEEEGVVIGNLSDFMEILYT